VTFPAQGMEKFLDTAFTKEKMKFVEKMWALRDGCFIFLWKGECHADL
jgi:hypothetical protein